MSEKTLKTRCVVTPHPVTCEGQTNLVAEFLPGEKLGAFLRRTVDGFETGLWHVAIGGLAVAEEYLNRVAPRQGQLVEVRAKAGKQALYIVAMVALTYFTFGMGTAAAGAWGGVSAAVGGGIGGALAAVSVYVAGAAIGGKVIR